MKNKRKLTAGAIICLTSVTLLGAAACSKPQPQAMAALEVEVVQVEQKDIPVYGEWIGTLDGMVNAEIRGAGDRLSAQAALHRRLFRQKRSAAV